jgi:hypothetical protein
MVVGIVIIIIVTINIKKRCVSVNIYTRYAIHRNMKSIILVIALLLSTSLSSISIVNAEPPLPYCDKVFNQSCYDRQDTDDITGLAPCNDGTQVPDYHDCPDAMESRNITAFIHLNEQVIEEDDSNVNLDHGGRYIVDGKNYSDWTHDMIEWVYPDEADEGPNFDTIEDELMVADNASQICFEVIDYRSCSYIDGRAENATEIHFSYPASWTSDESTESRNITAFIHFNREAIKEDTYLGDIWWTVDGKNYSNSNYDMSDAVYGDDPEIERNLFIDGYSDELMVADNASKICFEERSEDPDYNSCDYIKADTTEMHFSYPASWQPDKDTNTESDFTKIPSPYCDKVAGNLYPDHLSRCFDRQDTDEVTGLAPFNDGTSRADYHDCPDATGMP